MNNQLQAKKKLSFTMFLVTLGIVYGDIGTSPLYVMKSIMMGNGGINAVDADFIIGSLSLVIWTITLLTTVKYVLIALQADNNGEGGIFSLYSLVRRCGKWLIIPAMIGGAALLADGALTPAVTVTTAIEGLRSIPVMDQFLGAGQVKVIIITLAIIITLFCIQHEGTSSIGKAFGPCMLIWFAFLGATGLIKSFSYPLIIKAFNPVYAIQILFSPYNKAGFMILGSVFLATTGAEALYSDMGHVGKENIYITWPFVKICLILNYFGQGAWIINNCNNTELAAIEDLNPFFQMLSPAMRPVAIILSTMAAVIASQALITGSFTLVSEAIHLDLMPHLNIKYPSDTKGQMYIGTVNWALMACCIFVVLYFRSGTRIESAYGLTITIAMIATTLLLFVYLWKIRNQRILGTLMLVVFGAIQIVFFISSLDKFAAGGYVAVFIALLLFFVMFIWYRGTIAEKNIGVQLQIRDYLDNFKMLHDDESLNLVADNLIVIENNASRERIDRDVLYSILDKDPKRAKAYWLISVNVVEDPDTMEYSVLTYGTDYIFRIKIFLGFKVRQCVNIYLRQIIEKLIEDGELPPQQRKYSIYGDTSKVGTFKLVSIRREIPRDNSISSFDAFVFRVKYAIRRLVGSKERWYEMDTMKTIVETVPLVEPNYAEVRELDRVEGHKKKDKPAEEQQ